MTRKFEKDVTKPAGERRSIVRGEVPEGLGPDLTKYTRKWDATEHLKSNEDIAAFIVAALDEEDPRLLSAALQDVARAKGWDMSVTIRPRKR